MLGVSRRGAYTRERGEMMEFTPITPEEFYQNYTKTRVNSPFHKAVEALEVGTGFSTPCLWKHSGSTKTCAGIAAAHRIIGTQHMGGRVRTRCKDGTLHILRIEDKRA